MEMANQENMEECYYSEANQDQVEEVDMQAAPEVLEESVNVSKQDEGEVEEPITKSSFIDTDALIKGEMKQLLFTKVSEEITAKALNDLSYYKEKQVNHLTEKSAELTSKNTELSREVEIDKNRLQQSETIVMKSNEMVVLLKGSVEKLEKVFTESCVKEILDQSQKQEEKLNLLKSLYGPKLKEQYERIQKIVSVGNERKTFLTKELTDREEILDDFKKRYGEVKGIVSSYDEEIEKIRYEKIALEKKFIDIDNRKKVNENKEKHISNFDKILQKLRLKKDNILERLEMLSKQRSEMVEKREESRNSLESIKSVLPQVQEEIAERQKRLGELKEQLNDETIKYDGMALKLKQNHETINVQLRETEKSISTAVENNNALRKELEALKNSYLQKCEDKVTWTNRFLNQKNLIQNLEMELAQNKILNSTKRDRLDDLRNLHGNGLVTLDSINRNILNEQEKVRQMVKQLKEEYEVLINNHEQHMSQMKKKKGYSLATTNCLQEKSESARKNLATAEVARKNVSEELASIQLLTERKGEAIAEFRQKMEVLRAAKTATTAPLRSVIKPPGRGNPAKRVQFNEIPSFKSTTESENSSQVPTGPASALETSFHDWLQEGDDWEEIEQEK